MTLRIHTATAAALAAAFLVAGCSSSASTPAASTTTAGGIGAPLPSSALPSATSSAPLGQPIHRGDLTMTISGPPSVQADGGGLDVTFNVSMTNTGSSPVAGPGEFGVRCDANRGDGPGGWLTSTTAAHKVIPAGQTVTGTAVVQWVDNGAVTKCTGVTTIEADWTGTSYLAWTIPPAEVATVNAGGGASATPTG